MCDDHGMMFPPSRAQLSKRLSFLSGRYYSLDSLVRVETGVHNSVPMSVDICSDLALIPSFGFSNSNHRLKSAVDMQICVLKRGDKWPHVFTWKWDQILASKRGKFARQRNKMAANLDFFRMHLHRQPKVKTKLNLRSPMKFSLAKCQFQIS